MIAPSPLPSSLPRVVSLGILLLLPFAAAVGQNHPDAARATRVDRAPRLDGTLDDPLWQTAVAVSGFRQREPNEGQEATEKSEVRILYTHDAVYFGVRCYDSQPSRIVASELRRDVSQDLDDHFEILIDSDHDRRAGAGPS